MFHIPFPILAPFLSADPNRKERYQLWKKSKTFFTQLGKYLSLKVLLYIFFQYKILI